MFCFTVHLKRSSKIHIIGRGDFTIKPLHLLLGPCPLPEKKTKQSLKEWEKMIYAPMSGIAKIVYDENVVYIDLGGGNTG